MSFRDAGPSAFKAFDPASLQKAQAFKPDDTGATTNADIHNMKLFVRRFFACLAATAVFSLGTAAWAGNAVSVQQPNSLDVTKAKEAPDGTGVISTTAITALDQMVANTVAPPNIVGCHDPNATMAPTNAPNIVKTKKAKGLDLSLIGISDYGNVEHLLDRIELRANGPNSPASAANKLVLQKPIAARADQDAASFEVRV